MKNVLIVNAAKEFGHSGGKLNAFLTDVAQQALVQAGHAVKVTHVDQGYDIEAEIGKYLWADTIIYQMPAWWMGEPWILKKYVDEVFTTGHGKLFRDDGRSRTAPSKNYGKGGMLQGKSYMLSVTWNAPVEAFTDPVEFFEGKGVDAVYFPFHKANQFIGLSPLPTFMCNDVMKQPEIENDVVRYRAHLAQVVR
ncbi:MAG: dehydrogenase (quinone) [Burkholderiaceae bacterium]|nr:dehydrogenase (quinone) [Burkholderiaceae bacterium]